MNIQQTKAALNPHFNFKREMKSNFSLKTIIIEASEDYNVLYGFYGKDNSKQHQLLVNDVEQEKKTSKDNLFNTQFKHLTNFW